MLGFGDTVIIKDQSGSSCKFKIYTPSVARLSFELWRNDNFTTWRPHALGGDWSVMEPLSFIKQTKGEVWYRRSGSDFGDGMQELGDARHLDIFLYTPDCGPGEDDWGITLRAFFSIAGMDSSGGDGYLNQPWALQSKPGAITWDMPSRYRSL
jgi:hypothetical protein